MFAPGWKCPCNHPLTCVIIENEKKNDKTPAANDVQKSDVVGTAKDQTAKVNDVTSDANASGKLNFGTLDIWIQNFFVKSKGASLKHDQSCNIIGCL